MNAPDSKPLAILAPVDKIHPSPANPRKRHNAEADAELDASVKTHGVVQPILLRPLPMDRESSALTLTEKFTHFEIVCGERRWRAAQRVGLTEILATVRELTNAEALELSLTENLEREDMHEIEVAEGYESLMKQCGMTADQLAEKFGKSRRTIFNYLKLLALVPAARDAFYAGQIDSSRAGLIARHPAVLQPKILKDIVSPQNDSEPLSYRLAKQMIERKYMLDLNRAPFSRSDEALIATAGSCTDCPKRSGKDRDLFDDIKNADICTDPECHAAKVAAHVKHQRAQAQAEGRKVIDGKAAKAIKPNSWNDDLTGGYVELDRVCADDPKLRTVRQLLGKDAPAAELLVDPHNPARLIEIASKTTIKDALKAKGIEPPQVVTGARRSAAEKKAEEDRRRNVEYRRRLFENLRGRYGIRFEPGAIGTGIDPYAHDEWRLVADRLLHSLDFEGQKRIARYWIGPQDKADDHALVRMLFERVGKMARDACARLMLEAALAPELPVHSWGQPGKPERMLEAAAREDIDAAAIKAAVIKEAREKAARKGKPKAKAKAENVVEAMGAKAKPKAAPGAPPPSNAAQAGAQCATPAAPAGGADAEGAQAGGQAKPRGKARKAKADPAPAMPANEPAAPVETRAEPPALHPATAWPFPFPKAKVTKEAQA